MSRVYPCRLRSSVTTDYYAEGFAGRKTIYRALFDRVLRIPKSAPILFEAALPQRTAFTLDGEGEATLKLIVSDQFSKVLSDNIHRLKNCSFVVRIEGLES